MIGVGALHCAAGGFWLSMVFNVVSFAFFEFCGYVVLWFDITKFGVLVDVV